MPARPIPSPDAGLEEIVGAALPMIGNTGPFNLSHHPAMSVPCGRVDGLPIGLMLVGRHFDEGTIYRGAHAFEQAVDWTTLGGDAAWTVRYLRAADARSLHGCWRAGTRSSTRASRVSDREKVSVFIQVQLFYKLWEYINYIKRLRDFSETLYEQPKGAGSSGGPRVSAIAGGADFSVNTALHQWTPGSLILVGMSRSAWSTRQTSITVSRST